MKILTWKNPLLWYGYYQKDFIPLYFKIIRKGLKLGTPFFFSASNPCMEMGGLIASKYSILQKIPSLYVPKTMLIRKLNDIKQEDLISLLRENDFTFPVFVKPDIGERGWNARKINGIIPLVKYFQNTNQNTIVQEFIDKPKEYNVHYYRLPNESQGRITSLSEKVFLSAKGDGKSKLIDLIRSDDQLSNFVNIEMYEEEFKYESNLIVPHGEHYQISDTGSRGYGVVYKDLNHLISPELLTTYDNISKNIKDFYYGRYDIKVDSFENLELGKNIQIIELNGFFACPNHAWSPNFPIRERKKIIDEHLNVIYDISVQNHLTRNIPYMSFFTGVKQLFNYIIFKK